MSRWRAERMGTASHYENGKTIERLQRAFDGIERPAPKRPQTRAERRRLQRERDLEDGIYAGYLHAGRHSGTRQGRGEDILP